MGDEVSPGKRSRNRTVDLTQPKKVNRENRAGQLEKGTKEVVIHPPTAPVEVQEEDLNESGNESDNEVPRQITDDSDWVPGSSYLQRKLHSSTTADNLAYRLRSRLVGRSEQEQEVDNEQAEAVSLQENEDMLVNTHGETLLGKNKPAKSHSYNLRSRIDSTQSDKQE
jgi:hypothetical protein